MTSTLHIPVLIDALLQMAIAAMTLVAMILVMWRNNRWGNVLGLAAQPLWIYAHFKAGQFGMLAVAVMFTIFWAASVWEEFPIVQRFLRWRA